MFLTTPSRRSILCLVALGAVWAFAGPTFAQTRLFFDDFETGHLDPAFWIAQPGPGGVVEAVATIDGVEAARSGVFGVAMGRRDDGPDTTNMLDLHVDLAKRKQVELRFDILDWGDDTSTLDGLFFSDDGGGTFHKVYAFDPSRWNGVWGQLPPVDVDRLAQEAGLKLNGNFVIRFQQNGRDNFSGNSDGFLLDNVEVLVPKVTWARLPFSDDFESGRLETAWSWADPRDTAPPSTVMPQGVAGVMAEIGGVQVARNGIFGLAMGRSVDGVATTNALDLHLNLKKDKSKDIQLEFAILDWADDTDVFDGIWFSDNGGKTFKKVFAFDPDLWDRTYGKLPPLDVDRLAADNGLRLSNRFVIRFQQHGTDNFSGNADGFLIDDVTVRVQPTVWAKPPFRDGFDNGSMKNAWQWSEATATSLPEASRPQGLVEVTANVQGVDAPHEGVFAVAMGRSVDGGATANALDLRLDLSEIHQAVLEFWWKDWADDTDVFDGLWLSDDGGETFRKVFDFDPESLTNGTYEKVSLDLDVIARENGLRLSDRFVVRFQQFGRDNFSGNADGIFLDTVSVTSGPNAPSCSGFASFNARNGKLVVPDVQESSGCFTMEFQQDPDDPTLFKRVRRLRAE